MRALMLCLIAVGLEAVAATVVVDTTSDSPTLTACTAAAADCSLRGALIRTQRDLPGEDTIAFAIPTTDPGCVAATGVCTITLSTDSIDLASLVPGIQTGPSQGFTLDGYTQPGASANTLALGQGTNAQLRIKLRSPPANAREITTHTPFTIRGLVFENTRLSFQRGDGGSGGNGHPATLRYEFYGNFVGFDADGVTPLDTSIGGGSYLRTSNLIRGVRIGSGAPADINLFGAGAQKPNSCLNILGENRVQGNFIGVDRNGISGSGCLIGLQVSHQASPNTAPLDIGGATPGQGNVVGHHVLNAIDIIPAERNVLVRIRGNFIGMGVDGVTPAPNFNAGNSVCVPFAAIRGGFSAPGSAQIGGLLAGEGNLFGPNGIHRARCPAPSVAPPPYMQTVGSGEGMGVWAVQGNRYRSLQGMAVDLVINGDGQPQRLPNDADDADPLGANRGQNFPVISAFAVAGNQVNLTYRVDSTTANSAYPLSIEFIKDDGRGNLTPIGTDTYSAAQAQTDKAFGFTLPAGVTLAPEDVVVATATTTPVSNPGPSDNASGETSETSFHPLESVTLVSVPSTVQAGVPFPVRVRAVAAPGAPFKPNGPVLVQARVGPSPIPLEECIAQLAPVATARTSEGECLLVTNAPPGTVGVRVSYSAALAAFALPNGGSPASVLQTVTLREALVVDTTSDNGSLSTCSAAPGDCSLRGAMARAFTLAGEDIIGFNIPMSDPGCMAATGVCTISLGGSIGYGDHSTNRGITLDGYTQPGASPNSLPVGEGTNAQIRIELAGGGLGFASAFTVRGLAFLNGGISAARADGVLEPAVPQQGSPRYQIHGNFFGLRADGVTPVANSGLQQFFGVDLFRGEIRGVEIGGPEPAQMNVYGGTGTTFCIQLRGNGHRVRGNLIGTDRSGRVASSCGFQAGIQFQDFAFPAFATEPPPPHQIGGLLPGEGNLISGLRGHAIANDSGAQQGLALVQGNRIGVAVDGVTPLPNLSYQDIFPVPTGAIRGDARPTSMRIEGNLFGPNGLTRGRVPATPPFVQTPALGQEVGVWESRGNRYRGMQGMTVDIVRNINDNPPRTPNDPGDPDQLQNVLPFTNRAQNFPEISAFALAGDQLTLSYRVDSLPANSAYPLRVEFYRDNGRGDLDPIGSDVYAEADAQQTRQVVLTLPAGISLGAGDVVVGHAITGILPPNRSGETSESTFYAIESFNFVSLTPATVQAGVPYRARVRVVAASGVPFKPNGRVLIFDGRGSECIAFVQAVAAERTGEGECELVSTGAPGSINVVASYSASQNSFALATGAHPANVARTLTLTAGITALELLDGNNQTAEVGAAFAQPLRVRAVGSGGAPVAGIPVQFSGPSTGASASFAPNPAVTGADGIASTTATAINRSGSYTVTARVGTLTRSFTLSNEPGLATALAIVSNLPNPSTTGQTVTVTTALNPQAGGPPPTGVIAVSANTGEACSIVLPASSCALTFATLGVRQIQASYAGDANYRGSKADFATQTVQPGPSLHIADVSQNEGDNGATNFVFTVTLDNALGGAVSVDFATANDTAVAPGDYSAASGTLNFSGSTTSRTISVVVAGDTTVEPDERFFVNLSNASGATITRGQGIGTILNDDQPPPPAARMDDATVTEATDPDEEVLARFRVVLDRPAIAPASLRVRTVSGTALAGADFDANDFVLAFGIGERERVVEVFIRADSIVEPTESFTVELSEPQGLTLADAVATGTIFDAAFDGVLTVTSAADPGDGNCTPAECTLREAILLGNTLQSVGIQFAIPGTGPHTIRPLTPLPIPAAAIHTVDGYTQAGSRPNQLVALQGEAPQGLDAEQRIQLDGGALGAGSSGLTVLHGMTVRGLAIGGFAEAGIRVRSDSHRRPTRIVGNTLGSDGLGASARPNGVGLLVETGGIVLGTGTPVLVGSVGGRPAAARNLIAGNREAGIRVLAQQGTTQRMLHLDGNVIGMDAGLRALANGGPGIDLSLPAPDGLPTMLLERNLIGGNAGSGIRVLSRSETPSGVGGSLVSNAEQIGVPVANGLHGLELGGSSASVQGLRFEQTRIGPHSGAAVRVQGPATQASVVPARLPVAAATIDLGPQGPTPNDPGDVDSGPNGLLNTPVASSARFDATGARVQLALTLDTPAQPGLPLPEVLVYAEDESGLRRVGVGSLSPQGAGFAGTLDVLALPGGLRVGSTLRVQTRYGDQVSELSAEPVSATGQQLQATVSPVREAAGVVLRFVITLDGPVTAPVSIGYRSRDGSASAGLDYTAVSGGGTLSAAQPAITVEVPVLNDTLVEADETVLLEVASPNPGVAAVSASGLITDDDRLRQDRGQYDLIQLEQLAGLDGFIVDHPASANARLIDLGDFNGDTGRDLALGQEDRVQLLLGLPRPVPARVSVPAAGSAEFPLITRGFADVFPFGPTALGALRGATALPSLGLRTGVLHGHSAPLPASTTLASLAVPPDGAVLSGDFGVPLPLGDVNGDGRTDFLLQRLSGVNPVFGVVFGQPAGTALPASLAALNGSNGFVFADPSFAMLSLSMAGDVDGDGRADLLLRRIVGSGSGSRAENRLVLGRAIWPASFSLPADAPGVRSFNTTLRTAIDAMAGDFNGDGFGDLVLHEGVVGMIFGNGNANGLDGSAPASRIEGTGGNLRLTVLPDHDGNRAADLAIGDTALSSGQQPVGRVAILYGRASWPATVDLRAPPPAFVKFLDGPAGSTTPGHLAALGDYNGDGLGELAITMQGRSYVLYSSEAMFSGGSETRPPAPEPAATRVLDGAAPAEVAVLGGDDLELLPAGDVDGDGRADLLLGRSQPNATAGDRVPLLLVPGSALAGASALDPANPPAGSTRFRQSPSVEGAIPHRYAAGGDFDGDGLADLAFLRYGNPVRLAVLRGRPGGLPAFVEPMQSAEVLLGFAGSTPNNARELRYLGDIDGDGLDDLGVLRGNPGQLAELEVVFGRAPGGADRRATISAAPSAAVVLPNLPKLGPIRSGVAADAFVLGLNGAGAAPMMLVLGGPGFPASLNLNAPGDRAVRLTASHWRGPQDAVIVGVGDVTGDGIADLGVAHQPPSTDGAAQGVVALIPGRGSWPAQLDLGSADPTQLRGRLVLRGGTALDTLVTGLAALPDQNGDGRRELLISLGQSAALGAASGRALLIHGPDMPAGVQTELIVNTALRAGQGLNLLNDREAPALQSLQPLGDIDGDGRPELIGGSVPDAVDLQGLLYRGLPSVVRGGALQLRAAR